MTTVNRPNIMSWIPQRWNQFVGNYQAIRVFRKLIIKIRRLAEASNLTDGNQPSFLFTGESRTGKTSLVKFMVRCIACQDFDYETLDPCGGTCPACRLQPELGGLAGAFSYLLACGPGGEARVPVHFVVIDCTLIHTQSELRSCLNNIKTEYDGIRVIYFDEVHRLKPRGMDEMLLKAVEEKTATWIFSTAKPDDLEDMFRNRLLKITTELPTLNEMGKWLKDRCNDWQIRWEPEAIVRVVEKSNRVAGTSLHALALASLDDETGLSIDLVENEWLPKNGA